MNVIRRVVPVLAVLGALLPAPAPAQSTVYLSHPMRVGARALGFAGSVSGDNPDATVLYVNPGALSYLTNSDIVVTHLYERSSGVMEENVAVPLFLRRGEVVGIAMSVNHVGHLVEPARNDFRVMQYGYDVSYARRIIPTISIGGTLNVRYARSPDSKLWGLSSAFGIFYYPTPDVSYGLSVTGLGKGIKYIYDGTATRLNSENIGRSIHAGSTLRFPAGEARQPSLTLSVAAEKPLETSGVWYYGGFEVVPTGFVAMRLGYFGAANGYEYASYGLGFRVEGWKVDLAMTPSRRSAENFQVTVSCPIWDQLDEIY